ncbi:MBL fold metallo-hydrolase [Jannaschia sp. M317]|uniref:MBL fold metallo-hydrolase n=1 Tax=Jannaschia sp. M317 TaxID=2867011 RepID=UPI0021A8D3D2|nr:MBL fold metallo-hydrolase [Jannaschia sp. M317]UWQ18378.1 MBL fold metallo-hydrolase [Jannaschia sp. M317]
MQDHVALLGTKGGPAIRPGSTMPTSSLLVIGGQRIVVDCGLGVTRGLCDQGMALADLSIIFITHLHSDHYLELGPLLHTAWTAGLKTPVTVWGPAGLDRYWDGFLASMADDIDLRIVDEGRPDLRGLVSIRTIDAGAVTRLDGISVTAMRVDHPPLTECFALSFAGARRVVFSADTAYYPPLADFAAGADLLIHEAMLPEAVRALVARVGNGDDRLLRHIERSHTSAADAARIAAQAGVKALALHHLLPSDDPDFGPDDWLAAVRPHWDGPLHLGRDGLRIPF